MYGYGAGPIGSFVEQASWVLCADFTRQSYKIGLGNQLEKSTKRLRILTAKCPSRFLNRLPMSLGFQIVIHPESNLVS